MIGNLLITFARIVAYTAIVGGTIACVLAVLNGLSFILDERQKFHRWQYVRKTIIYFFAACIGATLLFFMAF